MCMSSNTRPRTTRDVDSVAVIAKWIRRCGLPFAILAWTGVARLILWLAGHVIRTLLLLTIAALLAYAPARDQLAARLEGFAGSVVPLLTGLVGAVLDVILVAVISIYLLAGGSRVSDWLRRNMPDQQQGRMRFLLDTLQRVVGSYIRGQVLLCGLVGVLVGVGMQVIGGAICPLTGCAGLRVRVRSGAGNACFRYDLCAARSDQGVGHRRHRVGLLRRRPRARG